MIGTVWPEPTSSAAGWRLIQLMRFFHELEFELTFASTAQKSSFSSDWEGLSVNEAEIELNHHSFDEWIQAINPDAVLFDRFMTEEQFGWRVAEFAPNALRILDTEDLHCLRLARQKALKENREVERTDYFLDEAKREIASIFRSDVSIMISEVEVDLLQKEFSVPANQLLYLPFTYDSISVDRISWESRAHFVTIGNFLHAPNWDVVQYLKTDIWPLIRKALPKAEMHIYGSYASQKVEQLHNPKEGFLIRGRAESVEEVMIQSRVCLAPLRFGAGLKGKLFDALLTSTPSVTTNIGAEGMETNNPWPGTIADDPEAFAKAAIELYSNQALWQEASERCSIHLRQKFSSEEHAPIFKERIAWLLAHMAEHRQLNFMGAMLQHHTMKSTTYMSKWIEAKNKID